MNVEVEIKVQIQGFEELKKKLEKLGKFVKEIHIIDEYYTPAHRDFFKQDPPEEFLRIRTEKGKSSFEYHVAVYKNGEKTHTDEYETLVDKPEIMKKILGSLNFKKIVIVDKMRQVYDCGDLEICLDHLKNLGHFLEIEAKKDLGGLDKTKQACLKFLKDLNIKYSEVPEIGYPNLVLKGK